MTEKYIDLRDTIIDANDTERDFMCSCYDRGVEAALEYFDEHPDQAPGRTITESELSEAVENSSAWTDERDIISHFGIEVVPDPEPTNVERLKAMQDDWLRESRNGELFIEYLDRMGAKAPGGDDE